MSRRAPEPSERGMVTAETAVVLPLIAAFALALIWMVLTVIVQVQLVDASRDAARSLARGDDEQTAVAHARQTAPRGASIAVTTVNDSVTVTVEHEAKAPRWLLVPLPSVHLESHATVARESDPE